MLSNFIGGGQVFLHRLRMFKQVAGSTFKVSLLIGIMGSVFLKYSKVDNIDIAAGMSYIRASISIKINDIMPSYAGGSKAPTVNAYTAKGIYKKNIGAKSVIKSNKFSNEYRKFIELLYEGSMLAVTLTMFGTVIVFGLWTRFGKSTKADKKLKGGTLMDSSEVRKALKSIGKASSFKIGQMPLVKDSQTKHFLVTGSTGCGKTNLMHNLLPQVEAYGQPAIIIDQTGEMIAKYYNKERGDIIFNPFDERSHAWDFWADCAGSEELERFSNILFSFNRKKHGHSSDPFWEKSAEAVFTSSYEYLARTNNKRLDELNRLTGRESLQYLTKKLKGTPAERFLSNNNSITASSILAVLATSTKPLSYLSDEDPSGKFSLKEYFAGVKEGREGWLFLATKPSNRELTLPVISCLADLALSSLMEIGIDQDRKLWFVIDELAALGKLPALSGLMAEGRKYGACVLAGLQSLNQIYAHYGQHYGSTIFGQFGSKFFFRTDEPTIGKMISSMCGTETITKQQKNTSFGANTYRDGQSYTEQERSRNLVEYSDLTKLAVGECYALLPTPEVRLSKIQVPEKNLPNKNPGFESKKTDTDISSQQDKQLSEDANMNEDKDVNTSSDLMSVLDEEQQLEPKSEQKDRYWNLG